MLKLKRDLCPFLRDAAVFEGVGELICLADPKQKLRLCYQAFATHAGMLASGGERSEIDMSRKVLFAGSLIRVGTGGVPAVCHKRAAIATGELLVARVSVV